MKKILVGIVVASVTLGMVVVPALAAFDAFGAQAGGGTNGTVTPKIVLDVNGNGRVLLRGTISNIGGNSLTVNGWGGPWTINVGSNTQILPPAAGNNLSRFKTGDFVGVQGTINQTSPWTIDATLVRDWTYRVAVNQERQSNIQSVRETMRSNKPRNFVGIASNMNGNTFTLTVNGAADNVDVAANAQVVNRNWLTIPLTSFQNNDNVHVWGTIASGTINGLIVRDLSLPVMGSSTNSQ